METEPPVAEPEPEPMVEEESYECPECGTAITPDMATCPNCGVGLTFEESADETPSSPQTPPDAGDASGTIKEE